MPDFVRECVTVLRGHPAVDDAVAVGAIVHVRGALATTPLDRAVAGRAHRLGLAAIGDVEWSGLAGHAEVLDRAGRAAMAATLTRFGLFTVAGQARTAAEVCAALRVAPRHGRVVRRWLRELARVGILAAEGSGYRAVRPLAGDDVEARLAEVAPAAAGLGYGDQMAAFLVRCARHLPEVLCDEVSVQQLMFPDGRTDTADATYRDNLISRYVNKVAAVALRHAAGCGDPKQPLRVLEIGAGVGGTSAVVIPALADCRVDYLFTDVSPFFLTVGRAMFAGYPWVRYGLCDINRDLAEQGYPPSTVDVILAANVLHNARDVYRLLASLQELLTPGGWLVFIDTSREHPQVMVSTEFLLSPPAADPDARFSDYRGECDEIFPTVAQWQAALETSGLDPVACVPDPGHPLARLGQHVHVARARLRPRSADLHRYLRSRLAGRAAAVDAIVVSPRLP